MAKEKAKEKTTKNETSKKSSDTSSRKTTAERTLRRETDKINEQRRFDQERKIRQSINPAFNDVGQLFGGAQGVDPQTLQDAADPRIQQALQLFGGEGGGVQAQGGPPSAVGGGQANQLPTSGTGQLQPLPEAGFGTQLLSGLGGVLGGFPIFGPMMQKPLKDIEANRARIRGFDKQLVDGALDMMDTNPDALAEIIKNPRHMQAFERHGGVSKEDIMSISEMAKNLPISTADAIRANMGDIGITEEGKPEYKPGEKERQGKVKDSLIDIYKKAGKDWTSITDLDVATHDAASQAERSSYRIVATGEGIGLYNDLTKEMTNITPETMKKSNMSLKPIPDEYGTTIGYILIDDDDISVHQEIWFDHMIQDHIESLAIKQGMSPEEGVNDPDIEEKAKKKLLEDVKAFIKGGVADALDIDLVKKGIAGSGQQQRVPAQQGQTGVQASTNPAVNKYYK